MVNFYVRSTFGAWRSPAARIVRDDEVAGSNPVAPTYINISHLISLSKPSTSPNIPGVDVAQQCFVFKNINLKSTFTLLPF